MKKVITYAIVILTLFSFILPITNQTQGQTQTPTVSFTPSQIPVTQVNQQFSVNITISNVQNLGAWDANLQWDPTVLSLVGTPTEGDFLSQSGSTTSFISTPPTKNGTITDITDVVFGTTGSSGNGVLVTLNFQAIATTSSSTISLNDIVLTGPVSGGKVANNPDNITATSDSATATVSFTQGGAPSANAGPNKIVTAGSTVTFNGTASLSSGTGSNYTWSFTDGGKPVTLTGQSPTYTFTTPGIYPVTLTLSDSNGSSNSTVTITVQSSSKPVAVIKIEGLADNQTVHVGQQFTFDGTSSYEANNGAIVKYIWDLGLGSTPITTTNGTLTYAYTGGVSLDTTYNVTLTVMDVTGLNGTASTMIKLLKGASVTAPPADSATSVPTSDSSSPTTATSPPDSTPTATSEPYTGTSSIPPEVTAILVALTIAVLLGATMWLRKRTCPNF